MEKNIKRQHSKKDEFLRQWENEKKMRQWENPVLYNKADRCFKEKAKKQLVWEDMATEANLENDKFHSKPKNYFKALSSPLNTNQTTQSYPGKINWFLD